MTRHSIFCGIFLISILQLTNPSRCHGATSEQLIQTKNQIFTLIEQNDQITAEAAISQLRADFAADSQLPVQLYDIGFKYAQVGNITRFRSMCQEIISQYSKSTAVPPARLYLACYGVQDLIDQKNQIAAEAAIAKMKVDFSGYPDLPMRLYEIGIKYVWVGDNSRFRLMCQQIITEYPQASMISYPRLYLARFAVEDLIKKGDITGAEAATAKMETDFTGHTDVPWRLWEISHIYAQNSNMDHFYSICQKIVTKYPDSPITSYPKIELASRAVKDLIEARDMTGAEVAITKMTTDFAGHPELPAKLYLVGLKYAQEKKPSYFRIICNQIVDEFPNSSVGVRAKMHLSRFVVEELIQQDEDAAAEEAITQMQLQFAGNPELPARLCDIGNAYVRKGNIPRLHAVYNEIISKYPNSPSASFARLYFASLAVKELIDKGDEVGAEVSILKMKSDFATHGYLPQRLSGIARQYAKRGNLARSRLMYEQVVAEFPTSSAAVNARMHLSRLAVEEAIDQEDAIGVETRLSQMKEDFAGKSDLPWRLWDISRKYYMKGDTAKANALCQDIATNYNPSRKLFILCVAKPAGYQLVETLKHKDPNEAETLLSQIKGQFTDLNEQAMALHFIADELYMQAVKYDPNQPKPSSEYINQAIAIYENDVLKMALSNNLMADAYYVLGLSYQQQNEYAKAAQAFASSYQNDPGFCFADYCLYAQGQCYTELINSKVMSENETIPVIHDTYEKLIGQFPKSHYAAAAKSWIDKN